MPTKTKKRFAIVAGVHSGRFIKQIREFYRYPKDYDYWIKKPFAEAYIKKSFASEWQRSFQPECWPGNELVADLETNNHFESVNVNG